MHQAIAEVAAAQLDRDGLEERYDNRGSLGLLCHLGGEIEGEEADKGSSPQPSPRNAEGRDNHRNRRSLHIGSLQRRSRVVLGYSSSSKFALAVELTQFMLGALSGQRCGAELIESGAAFGELAAQHGELGQRLEISGGHVGAHVALYALCFG